MNFKNPFGVPSPSMSVDILLGKSYYVVKKIYDNLDFLEEVYSSDAIRFFFEHWEQVEEIIDNLDTICDIAQNLDAVLAAGSAFRYVSVEIEPRANDVQISDISPSSAVKVGDHLVTPGGNIYQVTWVDNEVCSVGDCLACIKGPQGDVGETGTGLVVLGVFETVEEFYNANVIGHPGDAWIVGTIDPESSAQASLNHVFVWDTRDNCWKDAGKLRGPKGETGASANVIKCLPDPAEYFLYLYENWDEIEQQVEDSDEEVIP